MDDSTNGVPFTMPVAPAYGGNYGGGFGGGFGGDGWWILLLILFCGGGWGNGFGGGFGVDGLYPWLNNSNQISGGFRDAMLNDGITSIGEKITSGFGDVATQLCGGFAGVNAAITNAQMANMQSIFGVQSALQNCCCENRANIADLKYTIATEACADRAAVTAGVQTVLDKLCALELDSAKREAADLRQQLNMAQLAASQTAQNAFISQGFANEVDALYNRLNSCPVPTTPVYGRTPIFTCGGNGGCGCNGGFMN